VMGICFFQGDTAVTAENMTLRQTYDHPQEPSRTQVWKMFDRVAHRYDFLNRILSLGIDRSWRKKMTSLLPPGNGLKILDLATGTADQLLFLFAHSRRVKRGVGMDLAEKMLEIGRVKVQRRGLADVIALKKGDATQIQEQGSPFDAVTISFGIRNVADVMRALREIHRVLKEGGRVLILEFSLPENRWVRGAYLFYLRHILPRLGGWISGDSYAYRYLNETIETFPYGEAFCGLLETVGFRNVAAHRVTFGVATIYQGDKPKTGWK